MTATLDHRLLLRRADLLEPRIRRLENRLLKANRSRRPAIRRELMALVSDQLDALRMGIRIRHEPETITMPLTPNLTRLSLPELQALKAKVDDTLARKAKAKDKTKKH